MKSPTFEIKVALIGPVSAGKSTLLNALLVGKYSEVSNSRATAGVNVFHLTKGPNGERSLPTISEDNQGQLVKETNVVSERIIETSVEKQLCQCRPDTKLVLVDVPGINEAEASSKYREYIAAHWKTYDFVILVMDSLQGVNTQEQIRVLEFVKTNMEKHEIPVLILLNKVDELGSEEHKIIGEAREKIASMFRFDSSVDLAEMFAGNQVGSYSGWNKEVPIILPISARNGYLYLLPETVGKERFKLMEGELGEGLASKQIGFRTWNDLSQSEKYDAAYNAIRDPKVFDSSHFDKFLSVFEFCVGGESTQSLLIEHQLRVSMEAFTCQENITAELRHFVAMMKVLPQFADSNAVTWNILQETFWRQYNLMEKSCKEVTSRSPLQSHKPIQELRAYYELARDSSWKAQEQLAIHTAESYLQSYIHTVVHSIPTVYRPSLYEALSNTARGKRYTCALADARKVGQLMDIAAHSHFVKVFGQELKLVLEVEYQRAVTKLRECGDEGQLAFHQGEWRVQFIRNNPVALDRCCHETCHKEHFGHAFWLFFQWMDSSTGRSISAVPIVATKRPAQPNAASTTSKKRTVPTTKERPARKKKREKTEEPPALLGVTALPSDRDDGDSHGDAAEEKEEAEKKKEEDVDAPSPEIHLKCLECGKLLIRQANVGHHMPRIVKGSSVYVDYRASGFLTHANKSHYVKKIRGHYIEDHNGQLLPECAWFKCVNGLKEVMTKWNEDISSYSARSRLRVKMSSLEKWLKRHADDMNYEAFKQHAHSPAQQRARSLEVLEAYLEATHRLSDDDDPISFTVAKRNILNNMATKDEEENTM